MKLILAATLAIGAIMALQSCTEYGDPDWQQGMATGIEFGTPLNADH